MKARILVGILSVALLAAVALPGSARPALAANHSQSHPAFLDKTRFVLHMGLAYYAFHHFIYARWKAGDFKSGAPKRTTHLIEAGVAALFTYHELKVAYGIAKGSNSKTLHAIIAPLNALQNAFNALASKWKKGQFSDSDVSSLVTQAGSVSSIAGKAGWGFKDIPVPVPGAGS